MKRKVTQKQLNEISSTILCDIINPLIYEDKMDPIVVFNYLKSDRFKYVFNSDMLILMGHYDNDIEEFTEGVRKSIQDRSNT